MLLPSWFVGALRVITCLLVAIVVAIAPARAQSPVTLEWDPPASGRPAAYVVAWGPGPGLHVASASISGDVPRYTLADLRPGLRYYVVVRAMDGEGRVSAPSNEITFTVPSRDSAAPPSAPTQTWPDLRLDVQRVGLGEGSVSTSPAGLQCGPRCSIDLPRGTPVTLAATAAPGSRFAGWTGANCPGTGLCTLTLDSARTVRAHFDPDDAGQAITRRFLAEGAGGFFTTRVVLTNPGGQPATASMQFLRDDGVVVPHATTVPPLAMATVDATAVAGLEGRAFATTIDADAPLVVDRTMTWLDGRGVIRGAHAETSLAGPARRWYLAEGATHAAFDLFYLLQNPSTRPASVRIRYLRPDGPPLEKVYGLPPLSRTSVWVDHEVFDPSGKKWLSDSEVSAVVDVVDGDPIVVERAMYDSRRGVVFESGHGSAGVTDLATRWTFAEGSTGPFFDLFLLIANPGTEPADIRATYLLPDGTRQVRYHRVGPSQRYTIWVDQEGGPMADTAVSSVIESTNGVPIVVERSMWWPGDARTWREAHNTPGATTTGIRWAVADGEARVAPGRATYLLVANPDDREAVVRVTLLFSDGQPAMSREFGVLPGSRFGLSVGDAFPEAQGHRFGAVIESIGEEPVPIVVERAMYEDGAHPWTAGTSVLATRLE